MQQQLSRSASKSRVWSHCHRKFYFTYYCYHLRSIDQELRLDTLRLKNLQTMSMRFGWKIHQRLSRYLTKVYEWKIQPWDITELNDQLESELDADFQNSKTKDFSTYDRNNKFWLVEHYYKQNIDLEYQTKKERAIDILTEFTKSDLHTKIINHIKSENKLFIEEDQPNFQKMIFKVVIDTLSNDPLTIMAQPDFWVVIDKNTYIIYDWKSGENTRESDIEVSDQLKTYAYKVIEKMWLEDFDIHAYEVFVSNMDLVWWQITKENIQEIKTKISTDFRDMSMYLKDQNIQKNIPLELERFEKTQDLDKCITCRFREVCDKT